MQALEGIKIIDFSKWLPGQYCGMVLGDFGADVIKVEDVKGDVTRGFTPAKEPGMSYWHLMLNRNKRGITVNLKTPAGREVLLRLLKEADVFLEGFRPGYLKMLGLDYESVSKINPRLIYCSITGFGPEGKYKHMPSHDLNVIGLAGSAGRRNGYKRAFGAGGGTWRQFKRHQRHFDGTVCPRTQRQRAACKR